MKKSGSWAYKQIESIYNNNIDPLYEIKRLLRNTLKESNKIVRENLLKNEKDYLKLIEEHDDANLLASQIKDLNNLEETFLNLQILTRFYKDELMETIEEATGGQNKRDQLYDLDRFEWEIYTITHLRLFNTPHLPFPYSFEDMTTYWGYMNNKAEDDLLDYYEEDLRDALREVEDCQRVMKKARVENLKWEENKNNV